MKKHYCECGCGEEVAIYRGKPRRFIYGHSTRTEESRKLHSERMMGNKLFEGLTHSQKTKDQMAIDHMREKNPGWNGGRTVSGGGYISILKPEHPFADINGRIKEERLIMEMHIGRYLKKEEIIHHIDHNKQNNLIENLQIVTSSEHNRIHHLGNKNRLGQTNSKETRRKISEARIGHIVTQETRDKISLATKGRKHTEEECIKMSQSRIGKKDSSQTRKKKSESAKKGWDKRRNKC